MSYSKNTHKLPDKIRIDTQATDKNEDEGTKIHMFFFSLRALSFAKSNQNMFYLQGM